MRRIVVTQEMTTIVGEYRTLSLVSRIADAMRANEL